MDRDPMSAHDEAVQAAYEQRFEQGGNNTRRIINAYLRHMRAAGYVVTKIPNEAAEHLDLTTWSLTHAKGFNAARAATLANAVEVPNE